MPGEVVLAQFSDIHFQDGVGGEAWDLDSDLRNELERDLARVVEEVGPIRGLLITGDVAFSGAVDEYERAATWLSRIAGIAGCRANDVWMVPGNHDVERKRVSESRTIQDFHTRMRVCDKDEIDRLLYEYLVSDRSGGDAHLAPLTNYIAFATRYECSISAQRPFWDAELDIGTSGYRLRIRGMTSSLISDEHDDSDANRMVIGSAQANVSRESGSLVMTLSHHPPSWLRDGEAIEESLRTRAHIQLWGHRHSHRARQLDGNLHLFAGAVHPPRGELDWEPRYNVLKIEIPDDAPRATLTLHARVWNRQGGRFAPDFDADGERYVVFSVPVEPHSESVHEQPPVVAEPDVTDQPRRDARRTLAFHFSSLAYQRRLSVARELDLLDPDTRDVTDQELFEIVLSRAVRRGRLADLWSAVHRERGIAETDNPFLAAPANPDS